MQIQRVYLIEDGKIYRNGELVGTYDSMAELQFCAQLSPPQQMQIRLLVREKLGMVSRKRGRRPRTASSPVLDLTIPPVGESPPAPAQDPRYGDKTPDFVEWMFRYHPAEARKKYALRRIQGIRMPGENDAFPQLPKVEIAPIGDIPESAMQEEAKEQWVRK